MATEFRDGLNRSWLVTLDFAAAKRVRGSVKIPNEKGEDVAFDIIDAGQIGLTMSALRSKYMAVGQAMYAICQPQCEVRGITEEQFLEGCIGDSLDEAARVLEEELILFFPKSLREIIRAMFRKEKEIRNKAMAQAEASIEAVTLDSLEASGQSDMNVPASSA